MGRVFLVDLDLDYQYLHRIVICRTCHAHVASLRDYLRMGMPEGIFGPIFSKVVNVQVDGPLNHRHIWRHNLRRMLANIYCVQCGDLLGVKYIQDTLNVIGYVSNEGCYHMAMRKISLWNGEDYSFFENFVYAGHQQN